MRRARASVVAAAILALTSSNFVSSCAPGAGGGAAQSATPTPAGVSPAPTRTVASRVPGSPPNSDPQPAVDAALRDAAQRLNLPVGSPDLHLQQVEERDWPDASLGCPQPGAMYAQVITPGFLIVVTAPGKQLEYHADSRGRVVLCAER